ncbi:hypothetical protein [Oenococcus oeni]
MANKSKRTWQFFSSHCTTSHGYYFYDTHCALCLAKPISNLAKTQIIIIILIISITSLVWGTYHDLKKAGFIEKNK